MLGRLVSAFAPPACAAAACVKAQAQMPAIQEIVVDTVLRVLIAAASSFATPDRAHKQLAPGKPSAPSISKSQHQHRNRATHHQVMTGY